MFRHTFPLTDSLYTQYPTDQSIPLTDVTDRLVDGNYFSMVVDVSNRITWAPPFLTLILPPPICIYFAESVEKVHMDYLRSDLALHCSLLFHKIQSRKAYLMPFNKLQSICVTVNDLNSTGRGLRSRV